MKNTDFTTEHFHLKAEKISKSPKNQFRGLQIAVCGRTTRNTSTNTKPSCARIKIFQTDGKEAGMREKENEEREKGEERVLRSGASPWPPRKKRRRLKTEREKYKNTSLSRGPRFPVCGERLFHATPVQCAAHSISHYHATLTSSERNLHRFR